MGNLKSISFFQAFLFIAVISIGLSFSACNNSASTDSDSAATGTTTTAKTENAGNEAFDRAKAAENAAPVRRDREYVPTVPPEVAEKNKKEASNVMLQAMLNKTLEYSTTAKCEMACRSISEDEVKAILTNGKISFEKSQPTKTPCPFFAVEGTTADGQSLSITYAMCKSTTVVEKASVIGNTKKCDC